MTERRDLPLFAWGDALRAARARRRILRRRGLMLGAGCAAVLATAVLPPLPSLVWNASASAPIGLYSVDPKAAIAPGDVVIAQVPSAVRELAARRRYVPANVPLVKRVVATAGDHICAAGTTISVNGRSIATRRATDSRGRPLPWWTGCRTLRDGALFLLMAEAPDSFDGRYFGPTPSGDVIGKASALWLR